MQAKHSSHSSVIRGSSGEPYSKLHREHAVQVRQFVGLIYRACFLEGFLGFAFRHHVSPSLTAFRLFFDIISFILTYSMLSSLVKWLNGGFRLSFFVAALGRLGTGFNYENVTRRLGRGRFPRHCCVSVVGECKVPPIVGSSTGTDAGSDRERHWITYQERCWITDRGRCWITDLERR